MKERLKAIYASHSARGLLRSGATIKASIRQMEEALRDSMTGLLEDVSAVSRCNDAFAKVDEAVQAMVASFGKELPEVTRMSGQQPGSSAASAALGLYYTMKSDIDADLIIARHGFVSGEARAPEAQAQPVKNKGGKPLAAHWDEMWATIAVQLWNGDLKPTTQADIKRVMLDWFTAREIEVGDTAVTERARHLWRLIEASQ